MKLLAQPSRTSCGPTCVAMLGNVSVDEVLAKLPSVRLDDRKRKRNHSTNVWEMGRLLRKYGWDCVGALRDEAPPAEGVVLLRIQNEKVNWHWSLLAYGVVYDPAERETKSLMDYRCPITWYELERTR